MKSKVRRQREIKTFFCWPYLNSGRVYGTVVVCRRRPSVCTGCIVARIKIVNLGWPWRSLTTRRSAIVAKAGLLVKFCLKVEYYVMQYGEASVVSLQWSPAGGREKRHQSHIWRRDDFTANTIHQLLSSSFVCTAYRQTDHATVTIARSAAYNIVRGQWKGIISVTWD